MAVKILKQKVIDFDNTLNNLNTMQVETVTGLAEQLADWLGIYGGCKSEGDNGCTYEESKPFCCRQGFVGAMEERIRTSVENEKKLKEAGL